MYQQVIDQLREHVAAAGLKSGDRLPSERELAELVGVSRASVKQAIVALEVQGLVDIRHGGGTYLRTDSLSPEPLTAMEERRRRLPDVLEAREALETKLVELAALRRTPEDLVEIDAALALMEKEVAEGRLGGEGDHRFHGAITAAARNELLAELMGQISERVAESRAESLQQPGRPPYSLSQHQRIADAVRVGDAEAAVEAMREHLRTVSRVRLLGWRPEDG